MASTNLAQRRKHFFGHPAGLFVLFFAEMWERFSYYGMRALLTLYMTKALLFSDDLSLGTYGAYTSLVYATPIVGGYLADEILGSKRAVILGGVLMVLGHAAMALDQTSLTWLLGGGAQAVGATGVAFEMGGSTIEFQTTIFLYTALAFLILGNGFFKPNISTMVGRLYDAEDAADAKRDSGFTIFYMGINVGALLAGLLCSYVGETYGWHFGFGLAAVGMIVGLITFSSLQKWLYGAGEPTDPDKLERRVWPGVTVAHAIYIGAFVAVPVIAWLVSAQGVVEVLLMLAGVVVLGILLTLAFRSDRVQRDRIFVIIAMLFFGTVFFAFFEQAGSSMTLFADRNVDRVIFGLEIPASVFQSVNPAFIILLAPVFAGLWQKLSDRGLEPRTPVKFGLGLVSLGVGFGVMALSAAFSDAGRVPMVFLALGYLLQTSGELSLSPVGLSKVTQLSPTNHVGVIMGAWFFSSAFANYVASLFARLASAPEGESVKALTARDTLPLYIHLFETIAVIAIIAGILCLLLNPVLKKRMHGVH